MGTRRTMHLLGGLTSDNELRLSELETRPSMAEERP